MSARYVFAQPLDAMRQLAGALTVRHCIISGSGTDAACSAYVSGELVPAMFRGISAGDFRRVDSMISAVAPYFCDSDGVRWTMSALESACSARDILPGAIANPLPAEWLCQRFDMIARLHIACGGVMTAGIDGYGESDAGFDAALDATLASATPAGSDCKASRCLVFDRIGGTYCASATLTVSGSALSPAETAVWGNPRREFRMSAFRDVHDAFFAGEVVANGGTMSIAEGVNVIDAGTAGTYRFAAPVYHASGSRAEAGMEEFQGDSAPVLLYYDL